MEQNMQMQTDKLTVQEDLSALAARKTQDDMADIILQSAAASGLQLSRLSRLDTLSMAKVKCREITAPAQGSSALAQTVQGALPAVMQSQVNNQIAQAAKQASQQTVQEIAKDGPLFRATASIKELMHYKAGGVGSAVMGEKGIVRHAGFQEVKMEVPEPGVPAIVSAINPGVIIGMSMQAMAMASGQYYMHQLTAQLKSITKQLDKLVDYHHDAKIGTLRNISATISDLTSKKHPDASDLIQIQAAASKAQEVFYEYLTRLDKISIEDITGNKKAQTYFSEAEIKALRKRLDDSEIVFTMQVCFQASLLAEKCRTAELAIRMRMNGYDARTEEDLRTLIDNMAGTFHGSIKVQGQKYLQPILQKTREYAENGLDKKIQSDLQTGITGTQSKLMQAFSAVERDEKAKKIKLAPLAKLGREAVGSDMDKAKQKTKKQLAQPIEERLRYVEENFEAQSKNSQDVLTQIDQVFRTPHTLLYRPGNSPGEERVFIVEAG